MGFKATVDNFVACAFCDAREPRGDYLPQGWAVDQEMRSVCGPCVQLGKGTYRKPGRAPVKRSR